MAVPSESPSKSKTKPTKKRPHSDDIGGQAQSKRTKSPGVRVVHGRIYDSENGKTCHQCRQKTMDFVASCKNQKGDKSCTLHICHKCLLNRYGEKAEEVSLMDGWACPKCRGICNCSCCMKRKGHKPTGILIRAAKATGLNSASELIQLKGIDNLEIYKIVASPKKLVSPKKPIASNEESNVVSPRKMGKENSFDASSDSILNAMNSKPASNDKKSKKREGLKEISNGKKDGDSSPKTSPKKSKVSEKVSENEVKTKGKDGDSSPKTSPKKSNISEKVSENEVKTKGKDGKRKSKKTVLDKVSQCSTKPENEKKKDDGKILGAEVKETSKDVNAKAKIKASEPRGIKKCSISLQKSEIEVELPLPKASILTTVWGIEFLPEDIGHALQFLEFCAAFGKVFDLKKIQGESILRELQRGSSGRRGQYSTAVRFHIQLLSLIQEDMGMEPPSLSKKNSWLQAFEKCISDSECVPEELSSAALGKSVEEYDGLNFSRKLRLLNFLCDEALCTAKLRNWIDEENSKIIEKERESKEKVAAARNKEKLLKQKLQDDMAKAILAKNGAPLTIAEHEDLILQIKTDVAQAQNEILRAKGCVAKRKQKSEAVRSEPNFLDGEGLVFWKLRCCGEQGMLLQDIGTWDAKTAEAEKWFIYGPEQKQEIDKYIYSIRDKRARTLSFSPALTYGSDSENV